METLKKQEQSFFLQHNANTHVHSRKQTKFTYMYKVLVVALKKLKTFINHSSRLFPVLESYWANFKSF